MADVLGLALDTPRVGEEARARARDDLPGLAAWLVGELVKRGWTTAAQLTSLLDEHPGCPDERSPAKRETRRASTSPLLVGRYRILGELARGGMGVVYAAFDPAARRRVAIKLIKEGVAGEQGSRRLLREGRLAAGLFHPNVIPIHEVGEDSATGSPYIVMELIEGRSLDACYQELDLRARVGVLVEVCAGVGHAHAMGVLHRDLKPANVLVTREGRVVVADFGLACGGIGDDRFTVSGAVVGTPRYMAPEQLRGEVDILGPPTDVWALGVMLYLLLTGQRPFDGESLTELQWAVSRRDPPDPRKHRRDTPRDLARICQKALQPCPRGRYRNATEMGEDLARWQRGEPVLARPPGALERLVRGARRRPWLCAGAMGLLLLLLIAWLGWRTGQRRREHVRLSRAARAAYGQGQWAETIKLASRAQALREDASLTAWVTAARRRLSDERRRHRKVAALRRLLQPIDRRLQQLKPYDYAPAIDVLELRTGLSAQLLALQERSKDPDHARQVDLWLTLGEGWLLLGRQARAERALDRALALAPRHARANYLLGRLYMRRTLLDHLRGRTREEWGEPMRAAEWSRRGAACVRRAVAAGEARSGLEYLAAQCYVALAEKDTQRLAGLCRDGVRRFRGRPGVEELWLLRGVAEPGAALAHWTRAVEIRPRFYEAYLLRSEVHWAAGRLREAHRDLDRALSSRPAGLLARARRAQVRLALQDRAGALRDARQVYRLAPAGPRGAALWSRALREAGRPQEALPVAQEACREHPDRAFLLAELGRVWLALGRSQDAVSAFRRAILLEPRRARYYNLRGSALYGLERYRAARRDFEQALRLEPDNALGWFNLGNAELMLGRRRQAVGAYTKALEKRPTHREARRQRARLLTALGELEAARSDLAKLVQGARGWQERRQLGLSLYRCGDRGGGRQQLQRAAREAPPAARASILRVLRDLDAAGR